MSITPSETKAKVGDDVTFTIVAENYGPDPATLWLKAGVLEPSATSSGYVVCGGGESADGDMCEGGVAQPGQTVTAKSVQEVLPTTAGSLSDTACAEDPDNSNLNVPNPVNGCKTATVAIDSQTCPVSIPGATQTLGGDTYTLEGEDTFTKNAPVGSFAQPYVTDANALPVVYTGDRGMGWTEYPDGWPSTYTQPPYASTTHEGYQPSTVQSVHDGVLDFDLHRDSAGNPVGASMSPLPGGNRYQTYGAWSFCERVPADGGRPPSTGYTNGWLYGYHQAPLLWPQNDGDWKSAESDFPEADLGTGAPPAFNAYAHYGGSGAQDIFGIQAVLPLYDPTQWHAYTQTWGPGFRSYYVDGRLVATSTSQVWSGPERWQLQLEPTAANPNPGLVAGAGDVYVKWVWIGTL